jgi:hypothetical protein
MKVITEFANGDCWPMALCWLFGTPFTEDMRELSVMANPEGCEAATDAWLKARGVARLQVRRIDESTWPIVLTVDGMLAIAIGPGDNQEGEDHCCVVQLRTGPGCMYTDAVFLPGSESLLDIDTLVFFVRLFEGTGHSQA